MGNETRHCKHCGQELSSAMMVWRSPEDDFGVYTGACNVGASQPVNIKFVDHAHEPEQDDLDIYLASLTPEEREEILAITKKTRIVTKQQQGMQENMFRNLLDEIGIMFAESDPFEPLEERDFVKVLFDTITEEPFRSWCEQWRIGDYPVYLMNLTLREDDANEENPDDLDA